MLLIGAPLVHEDFTDLLYLFPWHDFDYLLNHMLTVLLSAELVEILSNELIEAHDCFVEGVVVFSRLFLINVALQDGLDHKVAILVIDETLDALERLPDQHLLPLIRCHVDALLHHLAPILVLGYLSEVFKNDVKYYLSLLIRVHDN